MVDGQHEVAHPCQGAAESLLTDNGDGTMVVAVVAVREVQVSIDQVIDVVAVRYSIMAAVRAVGMGVVVAFTFMAVSAAGRVGLAHFKSVLVDVPVMLVVHMAVVQIIHVIVVLDRGVAAVGAVCVGMVFMNRVIKCHGDVLLYRTWCVAGGSAFRGMRQSVTNQIVHVPVGKKIERVLDVSAPPDDIVCPEYTKTL